MARPVIVKKTIKSYFESRNFAFEIKEEDSWVLFSGFKTLLTDGTINMVLVYHESDINVTTTYSKTIDLKKKNVIAEFLMRVNRYLKRGHFYLDYDNGSINFKMWDSSESKISDKSIDIMVTISVGSLEMIIPLINDIISGKKTVQSAVEAYINKEEVQEDEKS